jgi:hypothetical protein
MAQAKMVTTTAVAVAVLAVAALAGVASAERAGGFVVTGRVYCDPCRAGFETNVSKSVPGAYIYAALLVACPDPWRWS